MEVPGAGLGCADVVVAVVVGCADVEAWVEVGATVVVTDVVGCASVGVDADFGVRSPVVVPSGRPTVVSSPTSQYWVMGSERSVVPSLSSARPCHVSA